MMKINKRNYEHQIETLNGELVLTAKDLKNVLKCGINRAYELMRSSSFPSTKLGGRYLVTVSALNDWLARYENRTFYV